MAISASAGNKHPLESSEEGLQQRGLGEGWGIKKTKTDGIVADQAPATTSTKENTIETTAASTASLAKEVFTSSLGKVLFSSPFVTASTAPVTPETASISASPQQNDGRNVNPKSLFFSHSPLSGAALPFSYLTGPQSKQVPPSPRRGVPAAPSFPGPGFVSSASGSEGAALFRPDLTGFSPRQVPSSPHRGVSPAPSFPGSGSGSLASASGSEGATLFRPDLTGFSPRQVPSSPHRGVSPAPSFPGSGPLASASGSEGAALFCPDLTGFSPRQAPSTPGGGSLTPLSLASGSGSEGAALFRPDLPGFSPRQIPSTPSRRSLTPLSFSGSGSSASASGSEGAALFRPELTGFSPRQVPSTPRRGAPSSPSPSLLGSAPSTPVANGNYNTDFLKAFASSASGRVQSAGLLARVVGLPFIGTTATATAAASMSTPSPPPVSTPEPPTSQKAAAPVNYYGIAFVIENTLGLPAIKVPKEKPSQEKPSKEESAEEELYTHRLDFLAEGEFQRVYTLKPEQRPRLDTVPNDSLVIKHFKMTVDLKRRKMHEGRLASGYYFTNQLKTYAVLKSEETAFYRFAKIYNDPLADGFSICEKISGDSQAIPSLIECAKKAQTEEQLLELAPEMRHVQALFTFALKLAFEKGLVIDVSKAENMLFETVGDKKRLVVLDLYELTEERAEALTHVKQGLKLFAGGTRFADYNPPVYAYLMKDFKAYLQAKESPLKAQVEACVLEIQADLRTWKEGEGTTFAKKYAAQALLSALPAQLPELREKASRYKEALVNLEAVENALEILS